VMSESLPRLRSGTEYLPFPHIEIRFSSKMPWPSCSLSLARMHKIGVRHDQPARGEPNLSVSLCTKWPQAAAKILCDEVIGAPRNCNFLRRRAKNRVLPVDVIGFKGPRQDWRWDLRDTITRECQAFVRWSRTMKLILNHSHVFFVRECWTFCHNMTSSGHILRQSKDLNRDRFLLHTGNVAYSEGRKCVVASPSYIKETMHVSQAQYYFQRQSKSVR
jgi:hypothetical protein